MNFNFKEFVILIKEILIICLILTVSSVFAQKRAFCVYPNHLKKINKKASPTSKLKLYRKYFHKDSLKQARQLEKYWQQQFDSIFYALHATEKKMAKKLAKMKTRNTRKVLHIKEDINKLHKSPVFDSVWSMIPIDTTLNLNSSQLPERVSEKADEAVRSRSKTNIPYNSTLKDVAVVNDGIKGYESGVNYVDTLKSINTEQITVILEKQVQRVNELEGVNELSAQAEEMNHLKGMKDEYKTQMDIYMDSASRKEQAQKKAEEAAMEYISRNPQLMKEVQEKVNRLMKKYSVVPNSNDLSTAIKRTSLKGRSFRERLVLATNFQVLTLDPFSIDLAPTVGYRINSRFTIGLGGTYRQTFRKDSIPAISSSVWGYKNFVSYDILNSFFFYSEFARNTSGLIKTENTNQRNWEQAWQAGLGRRFSVHRKIDMTVVLTYNLLHQKDDSIYPGRWAVKVGFQTSELAMLKRRPDN